MLVIHEVFWLQAHPHQCFNLDQTTLLKACFLIGSQFATVLPGIQKKTSNILSPRAVLHHEIKLLQVCYPPEFLNYYTRQINQNVTVKKKSISES